MKVIQWNSNTAEIRAGELPSEFTLTSTTLIIANSWPQDNLDIAAIESRGHLIYFIPSFHEMHRYAKEFFGDEEIYDFIGERLSYFENLDLRIYGKAKEIKTTGLRIGHKDAWKRFIEQQMMSPEKQVALDLMRTRTLRQTISVPRSSTGSPAGRSGRSTVIATRSSRSKTKWRES